MHKKSLIKLIILLLLPTSLLSQHLSTNIGARESSMGGCAVASSDFWSTANNQASLGYNSTIGFGFYYENRFLTKEFSFSAVSMNLPIKNGGFGLNITSFGYSQYNEKKIGLAYGLKLFQNFALGVQLDYLHTYIGNNYGSKGVLAFELGLLTKINENFTLGAHVFNPSRTKLNDYNNERILSNFKLGLRWKLDKNFVSMFEVNTDIDNDFSLRAGFEYRIKDIIYTRIGISNEPNIFSFGVGIQLKSFKLDFASSMHQVLGYSPQFSLIYQVK